MAGRKKYVALVKRTAKWCKCCGERQSLEDYCNGCIAKDHVSRCRRCREWTANKGGECGKCLTFRSAREAARGAKEDLL